MVDATRRGPTDRRAAGGYLRQLPGHSAGEVEQLIATPLERFLYQIDGVEFVYSMSREGQAIITLIMLVRIVREPRQALQEDRRESGLCAGRGDRMGCQAR